MNMHTTTLPATMPDLDEMEVGFNKSLELFAEAFEKIAAADAAIKKAFAEAEAVTPGAKFHDHSDGQELKAFYRAVKLPERNRYLYTARKILNVRFWHYAVDRCGLQQLMDHQAKKELDDQLRYVPDRVDRNGELITDDEVAKGPPPFTAENARATLAKFAGDADHIWRRGIANVFSSLDRRFRSHDGFKVGGRYGQRIILDRFLNYHGWLDTYGAQAERFRDIERTFQILDGLDPRHARSDFLHTVDHERREMGLGSLRGGQSEHENEFFKVRVFGNGNAHLWFKRQDLVRKVNLELARYYGEVIGDAQTKEADPLESRALTPARAYGFYPTPHDLADKIAGKIPWSNGPQRILEPSAGTGNLAFIAATPRKAWSAKTRETELVRHKVDAIEIQPQLAEALRASGKLNRVLTADFLQIRPDPRTLYDGVIMNPPFDRERDIDHVSHALKFIKSDGWLLAIMSAGIEFRETRKAAAFRKLLSDRKGWILDLPDASFASVGTYVNTVLVGIGLGSKPWRLED